MVVRHDGVVMSPRLAAVCYNDAPDEEPVEVPDDAPVGDDATLVAAQLS